MFTHIVLFTWIDGVTEAQIDAFDDAMSVLAKAMSDMVDIRHGRDLNIRDGNANYAMIGTFADQATWAAYQAHPLHKAFVRDVVTPMQASRLTIQF